MNKINVLGIDPGKDGALVLLNKNEFLFFKMPYKDKEFDHHKLKQMLYKIESTVNDVKGATLHVMLERAVPMAQGAKSAFSYGRAFGKLEMSLEVLEDWPLTYVEPGKWAKVMHEGIDSRMKPKAKSVLAVERLYKRQIPYIPKGPKNGKMHEGVVDALLIAGYGLRLLTKG